MDFSSNQAGVVATTDIAHLAALHQAVERCEGLIKRRFVIRPVRLVEVDVVSAQAAQAVLNSVQDVQATESTPIWAVPHLCLHLGRDDHVAPAATA